MDTSYINISKTHRDRAHETHVDTKNVEKLGVIHKLRYHNCGISQMTTWGRGVWPKEI